MLTKDYFDSFFEYLSEEGSSAKTMQNYRFFIQNVIYPTVGHIQLHKFTLADISRIKSKGREHGIYGEVRAVSVFRVFFRFLYLRGIAIPFDYRDIQLPKQPRRTRVEYLSAEELDMVRNSFDVNTIAGLRTRALVELLLDTGMRIAEAVSLNKDDIDWERKEILVVNAKRKYNKHEKELVYFTDRSARWLKLYLARRRDTLSALFVSGRGRLLPVTSRNYIRKCVKDLPINKKVCHHIFRRTFATTLIQHDVDIKSVQTLLRHSDPQVTLRHYLGVSQERVKVLHEQVLGRM